MLTMPMGASPIVTIIGLDPGSYNLGVAVLHFNIETLQVVGVEAWTLKGDKLARQAPWVTDIHGDLEGRIQAILERFTITLNYFQPFLVASESPFINKKFPQAGLVLTRVVASVRQALMRHDVWKPLEFIDPPTVKNAVGVKGNRGGKEGKEDMKVAVSKLAIEGVLPYTGSVPLLELDEHSIDAIAVAYARLIRWLRELCLLN